MNYISVCSRGKNLSIYSIQPNTVPAQIARFVVLTVVLIKNEVFWDMTLCRSISNYDISEELVSYKFEILFSDFLNRENGGIRRFRNFRNSVPIYTRHIPEALKLHSSNSCFSYTQKQANPLTLLLSATNMTLFPSYLYQKDERTMPDNLKRCKIIFIVIKIVFLTTAPLFFLSEYSVQSSRFK
jgi:hypothetical protein